MINYEREIQDLKIRLDDIYLESLKLQNDAELANKLEDKSLKQLKLATIKMVVDNKVLLYHMLSTRLQSYERSLELEKGRRWA